MWLKKLLRIKEEDYSNLSHRLFLGDTGVGKTSLALYQVTELLKEAAEDIKAGRPHSGCLWLDPKDGKAYSFLLGWLATHPDIYEVLKEKIVCINPTSASEYSPIWNFLDPIPVEPWMEIDQASLAGESLEMAIRSIFNLDWNTSPRMGNILTNSVALLTEAGIDPKTNRCEFALNDLVFLFYRPNKGVNNLVRELLKKEVRDNTKDFWESDFGSWSPYQKVEWTQSSLNKLSRLLFNPSLEVLLGASTLNIPNPINWHTALKDYFIFMNFRADLLGGDVDILSNLVCDSVLTAGIGRRHEKPFYAYFDEVGRFRGSKLSRLVSQVHNAGIFLRLMLQNQSQLMEKDTGKQKLDEILGNCRQWLIFSCVRDSHDLNKHVFELTGKERLHKRPPYSLAEAIFPDYDYAPAPIEMDRHAKWLEQPSRQFIFKDYNAQKWKKMKTPDLEKVPSIEQIYPEILEIERKSGMRFGEKKAIIRQQIKSRHDRLRKLIDGDEGKAEPPKKPTPHIGWKPIG